MNILYTCMFCYNIDILKEQKGISTESSQEISAKSLNLANIA